LPDSDQFVFQNPASLSRKGILDEALHHELLHSAIHAARRAKNLDGNAPLWLEESFCTASYPVGNYDLSIGQDLLKKFAGDEGAISRFLAKALVSSSYNERRKGYALAFVYGKKLIEEQGDLNAFIMVATAR